MKNAFLYIFPLLLLFSCVDYGEEFSNQQLEGKWLNEVINDYESMDNILVFQTNGTYEAFFIRTENSEGFAPGILGYYKGKYAVADGNLTFLDRKYFYPEDYENPPSEPGMLVEQESVLMPDQNATLAFEENKTVMVLVYECIDVFGNFAAMCLEPEPKFYQRVME